MKIEDALTRIEAGHPMTPDMEYALCAVVRACLPVTWPPGSPWAVALEALQVECDRMPGT